MSDTSDPRLDALEARVLQLESELAELRRPSSLVEAAPQPPPPSPDSLFVPGAPQPSVPPEPRTPIAVESETVLKWVGVTLVVLAVGFAVSTAISRGWIGPELQLAGAVALAIALVAAGLRLRDTRIAWAHALCSGGVAALFTTFASSLFVDQTNTDVAFAAIAAVAVAGYALARLVPSEWVAIVALAGALVGWFVVADGTPPFESTLALAAGLALVAVGLSLDRGWFGLRLLGHLTALVMILALASDADTGPRQAAIVAAVIAAFLSLARVPSIGDQDNPWVQIETQLAMVGAPWAVAVGAATFEIDDRYEIGLSAFAVALVTAGVAVALQPVLRRVHLTSLVVGASVAVTIGLASVLDTEAVFVALAVQGAGLLAIGRQFGSTIRLPINAGILLFIAAMSALVGGVDAWSDDASVGVDLAHAAVIVLLGVASWQTGSDLVRRWGAAVVLGLTLIWLGSVLVHLPEGQAAVSVSWAVVGTALLVAGAVRKVPELGAAGLAVLALTVGKLLLVDMQEVDTLWRAGLFLLVGLGLMRLGFLLPRLTGVDDRDRR
ncbi:MAG: DUF2339 domain-containing protein [Acidimicrobiales bacterium]